MENLDEYLGNGNTTTCFTMNEYNPLYVEYVSKPRREVETKEEEVYEWKCFLLHKYLSSQVVYSLLRVVIGILVLVLSIIFVDDLKKLPAGGFLATFALAFGFVYSVLGVSLAVVYKRMTKNHRQYMWQEKTRISEKMKKYFMENYFEGYKKDE